MSFDFGYHQKCLCYIFETFSSIMCGHSKCDHWNSLKNRNKEAQLILQSKETNWSIILSYIKNIFQCRKSKKLSSSNWQFYVNEPMMRVDRLYMENNIDFIFFKFPLVLSGGMSWTFRRTFFVNDHLHSCHSADLWIFVQSVF